MLTCKDFLRELSDFLDETADAGTKKELERHMSECPNCWVVFDTTKKTLKVFKGQEAKDIPESIHSRLMSALQRKMAARKCSDHPATSPHQSNKPSCS